MDRPCLYRRQFDSIEQLDAFVNYFQLVRGIEFRWNRLTRTVWLHCDQAFFDELSCVFPSVDATIAGEQPCRW